MFLIIVGTGVMGQITAECAAEDGIFDEIASVEPLDRKWPSKRADLIIDFSHPEAIQGIYEYCRDMGGNIPVVIGTTGQQTGDEEILKLLEKNLPGREKVEFLERNICDEQSRVRLPKNLGECDISIEEIHHTKKIDAPSGTAKTLCMLLDMPPENAVSIRLGTVFGQHKVYFALEDEVIEICHTAFSKKIFARGALETGKKMLKHLT